MDLSALAPFLGPTLGPNPFCRWESFIMEQYKLRVSLLVAICTRVHVGGSPCIHKNCEDDMNSAFIAYPLTPSVHSQRWTRYTQRLKSP